MGRMVSRAADKTGRWCDRCVANVTKWSRISAYTTRGSLAWLRVSREIKEGRWVVDIDRYTPIDFI